MKTAKEPQGDPKVLVIERVFDAPRERVFKAWVNAEDSLKWGGPREWPLVETRADVRVGGSWRSTLRNIETGDELHQGGVYKEIKAPERLVFTFAWDNHPEPNREMLVTVVLENFGDKTKMYFRQEPFDTVENRDGHNSGWNSAFDRLDAFLDNM